MASRFIDTTIWNEDWFCELGSEYQLFWNYVTCQCNNAGIWKPNKIDFEIKSRAKINLVAFIEKINERGGKDRIIITDSGRWFLTGFVAFQWFNKTKSFDLVLSNKLHKHIFELLIKEPVPLEKVRGLKEVLKRSVKTSKDKDIFNNSIYRNNLIDDDNGGLKEVLGEVLKKESIYGDSVLRSIESLKDECLSDGFFSEHICRQTKIKPEAIPKFLNDFNEHLKFTDVKVKNKVDYRTHFINWLRKQDNGRTTGTKQNTTGFSTKNGGFAWAADQLKNEITNGI